ncbi:MAG: NADPH-dependent 7-cyano-7-deazaguanine reductase QueF [Porticoccaceae bacterium]|jgi:7-cyano-7-deazaguanine reductase|nr:NADPH-dependent 7-cyano-7-deazaguanine reductase QueF [Porticoccaceae bacterium]
MAGKPQLGAPTEYPDRYAPELLVAIPRAEGRAALGGVAFHGVDIWTAYELSWLDPRGKPQVAIGEFTVPCESPNIVESKSFKLYLNSFNQERIASSETLAATLGKDLGAAFGATLDIALHSLDGYAARGIGVFDGICLDGLDIDCADFEPQVACLATGEGQVAESLYSHLLKTNCPVTGQPDWASVRIRYRGAPIDRGGLLRYLVSFRQHQDFHEHCVERIYSDILHHCAPEALEVYARYTRRGGLDINPFRASAPGRPDWTRLARQ